METTLKPYPSYQIVGHEWLGQVPSHWVVLPNRALFEEIKDQGHSDEPLLSVTISRGVIPQAILLAGSSKKDSSNLDKSKYKLVEPGDIAYNKMRAWQGALGVSEHRGIVSPAYIIVRPRKEVDSRYFHYLLRTPAFVKEAERWSYGITSDMWSLRYEDFKQIYCVLPPLDEQRQMARYLDSQYVQVSRLVRAKQRLIALLTEQKQAIIQRAVTRGLDPDVPLKPSGVEWLGDVPDHWEVWQIGHFSRVGNGSTPSRGTGSYWRDGRFPWLNSSAVNQGDVWGSDQFVTARALTDCHLPIVPPRSVLVAITGQGKTRGMSAILHSEATISQHVAYISPRNGLVSADYIRSALRAAYHSLRAISEGSGSTKGAITCSDLRHFKMPVPPTREQEAIVAHLDSELGELDAVIHTAEKEIALIREYRQRLVADVVTGKLDVRGVTVHEVEDDETDADLMLAEGDEPILDDEALAHGDD